MEPKTGTAMSRGRKVKLSILAVITAVIVLGGAAIAIRSSSNKHKVIAFAEEYLKLTYEQEMIYDGFSYTFFRYDGTYYCVYFVSAETNTRFRVCMWPSADEFADVLTLIEYEAIWDDYLSAFLQQKTAEVLLPDIQRIWDENSSMFISRVYPGDSEITPTEYMTLHELELIYNYTIFIKPERILDSQTKYVEAQRILEIFRVLKERDYSPHEMIFRYYTGEIKNGQNDVNIIWFGDETEQDFLGWNENWAEITNVQEVVRVMNEQWFNA